MPGIPGRIILDGKCSVAAPVTVYIRLLDTSRIDAPAQLKAELALTAVRLDEIGHEGLPFCITLDEEPDPRARYEISVLADVNGDGKKSVGDYITMRSYPVLTAGSPTETSIRVQRISGSTKV